MRYASILFICLLIDFADRDPFFAVKLRESFEDP
jgi:hypothetical protein